MPDAEKVAEDLANHIEFGEYGDADPVPYYKKIILKALRETEARVLMAVATRIRKILGKLEGSKSVDFEGLRLDLADESRRIEFNASKAQEVNPNAPNNPH